MSKRIIKTVSDLLTAVEADALHGQVQIPAAGNWNALLWLKRYAKEHTSGRLTRDLLMELIKRVNDEHGLSVNAGQEVQRLSVRKCSARV